MHLLIGGVIPQAEWREQWWSSLRLICQSQRSFISRSTLTATEPFSITEHWKPTDPQSRLSSILHSHSMSTHLKRLKETIKCHNVSTGCTHLIECSAQFLKQLLFKQQCIHRVLLRSTCRELPWVPVSVQSPEHQTAHAHVRFSWPMSAPCWHKLIIYLFLACRLVSPRVVTLVVLLSKWCKNKLKTECNFSCLTGFNQVFLFTALKKKKKKIFMEKTDECSTEYSQYSLSGKTSVAEIVSLWHVPFSSVCKGIQLKAHWQNTRLDALAQILKWLACSLSNGRMH